MRNLIHPLAMTTKKKPRRRLHRRQKYVHVSIGVNFRQLHLQRAMNTILRCMKVRMAAKMELKMKRMKKSLEETRVELREMEAKLPQLRAERIQALQECAWTQACYEAMEALLFAP